MERIMNRSSGSRIFFTQITTCTSCGSTNEWERDESAPLTEDGCFEMRFCQLKACGARQLLQIFRVTEPHQATIWFES